MTEPGNGYRFNENVEATAFAGSVDARLKFIEQSLSTVQTDMRVVRTRLDGLWAVFGLAALVGPIAVTIAIRTLFP